MYSIVKIYGGVPRNNGHERFEFTTKAYKKVYGVLFSGGARLSLSLKNGQEIILRSMEHGDYKDTSPNERPFYFTRHLEFDLITGVVESSKRVSIYLLME